MNCDTRRFREGLEGKGFRREAGKKSDVFYCFYVAGVRTQIRSKVGGHDKRKYKVLGPELLSRIKRSLHFDDMKQMKEFIECTMSEIQYVEMLKKKEKIRLG